MSVLDDFKNALAAAEGDPLVRAALESTLPGEATAVLADLVGHLGVVVHDHVANEVAKAQAAAAAEQAPPEPHEL